MSRKSASSQPILRLSDRNSRSYQRRFGRNPDNLHVLVSNEKKKSREKKELERNIKEENELRQIMYPSSKDNEQISSKKKRSRRRNKSNIKDSSFYHWHNPNYTPQLNLNRHTVETLEDVSDAPLDEGDFEEVEVASVENVSSKSSEIPVGFRKSKLRYLRYKRFHFFKPKVYDICSQRTIVNCLNLNEDESVEVDIVSEAEYEGESEISKVNFGVEVNGKEELFECEKLDVKYNTADELQSNRKTCTDAKTFDGSDMKNVFKIELVASEKSQLVPEVQPQRYRICIPNSDPTSGFYQGEAVIQDILNAWTSHLIGLEYLVEIRNSDSNKTSVRNYRCFLCDEDISVKPVSSDNVINHIINSRHMIKYLEKHFPSCGYNFSENAPSNSSEIVLQKCCEEINNKLGYHYMCIADYNYYKTHKQDIKTVLNNASHLSEKNCHLDFKKFESDIISKEVNRLIEDIMLKILGFEEESEEEIYEVDDNFDDFVEDSPGDEKEIDESNEFLISDVVEDLSNSACESDFPEINETQNNSPIAERNESADERKRMIHIKSDFEATSKDINSEKFKAKQTNSSKPNLSVNGKKNGKKSFVGPKPRGKFRSYLMLTKAIGSKGKEVHNTPKFAKDSPPCEISKNKSESNGTFYKSKPIVATIKEDESHCSITKVDAHPVDECRTVRKVKARNICKIEPSDVESIKETEGFPSDPAKIVNACKINEDRVVKKVSAKVKPDVESIKQTEGFFSDTAKIANACKINEDRVVKKVSAKVKASGAKRIKQTEGFLSNTAKIANVCKINEDRVVKKVTARNKNLCKQKPSPKENISENKLHSDIAEVINIHRTTEGRIVKKINVRNANLCKQKFSVKESITENKVHHSDDTNITNFYPKKEGVLVKKVTSRDQNICKQKPSDEETSKGSAELHSDTNVASIPTISGDSVVKKSSAKSKHRGHMKPSSHSKYCLKRILGKSAVPRSVTVASGKKDSASKLLNITVVNTEQKSGDVKQWEKDVSGLKRKEAESPDHSKIAKQSESPVRRIRSPLRNSRSPLRLSHSSRRRSRSPLKRHSRSPPRRRSPYRKRYESPLRRHSRSPRSRHAQSSSRRLSRSPAFDFSRSPNRKRSKSPLRRTSRSPLRRTSRSPFRRRSRSPLRRFSRSPRRASSRGSIRKYSRSPVRRYSKSPLWRHSRSPIKKHSVSPPRRRRSSYVLHSRSPPRRHSRSIERRNSRSPGRKSYERAFSRSPHRAYGKSSDSQDSFRYGVEKSVCRKDYISAQKYSPRPSKQFEASSGRAVSDLDSISDEDESVYFNTVDKSKRVEEMKLPPSTRSMLAQMLQKMSGGELNPDDPSLNKLMHFMNAHSGEIQQLLGTQPQNINERNIARQVESDMRSRNDFLQRYLLSNLAGNPPVQQPVQPVQQPNFSFPPSVPGAPVPVYSQLPFPPVSGHPIFPPVPNTMPPRVPGLAHQSYPRVQNPNQSYPRVQNPNQAYPRVQNPNQSCMPPSQFNPFSQSSRSKLNVPSEVMFKDLKAKVTKLFGAQEAEKIEKEKSVAPRYVTEPDPEKWDLNHPATPKFNPPVNAKNVFHPQSKDMGFHGVPKPSTMVRDGTAMPFAKGPGHFFSDNSTRPNIQKVPVPPPSAKVAFCDVSRTSSERNLFPVVSSAPMSNFSASSSQGGVNDVKLSLAQRLASVLVKVGMMDVPAPLLQEMLMKIGAFSSCPPQDIRETEIINILRKLGYLS